MWWTDSRGSGGAGWCAGILLLLGSVGACASGTGPPPPLGSQFRVLPTALNGPAIDVAVDGRTQLTSWPFGQLSKAIALAPGDHAVVIQAVGVSSQFNLVLTTASGVDYTAFVVDSAAFAEPIVVDDAAAVLGAASGALRVASYAALAPVVDVRRSQPDSMGLPLVGAPFAFRTVTNYFASPPGVWTVVVSHHGMMDTLLTTGAIAIGAGQARTVVLLDSVGGLVTWRLVSDRN